MNERTIRKFSSILCPFLCRRFLDLKSRIFILIIFCAFVERRPCQITTPIPNPSPICKKLFSNSPLTKMKLLPVWKPLLLSSPVATYTLHILVPTVHFTLIPLHSHRISVWMFRSLMESTPWVGSLRFPNFFSTIAHWKWINFEFQLFTWMTQLSVVSNGCIRTT